MTNVTRSQTSEGWGKILILAFDTEEDTLFVSLSLYKFLHLLLIKYRLVSGAEVGICTMSVTDVFKYQENRETNRDSHAAFT